MRIVMTLLVRDEIDVIDDQLSFHLASGVDFVVAADNESSDGTTEILERYAREGRLHRVEVADPFSQVDVMTTLAHIAATQFDADWVINSDADEFWWARGASLKEILASVPMRYGSVRGMWRNFAPRPDGSDPFAERMTVRSQEPRVELHPLNTHFKTVHRAGADVQVGGGNHDVVGNDVRPVSSWYPIDVLHFPIRSFEQFSRKFLRWWEITSTDGAATNPFYNRVRTAQQEGRLRELYESFVVDDAALPAGVAAGTLVEDTRLRDALRVLRRSPEHVALGGSDVDQGYLIEFAYLEEHSPLARAQNRVEALEQRLGQVEQRLPIRVARKLRPRR